MTTRRTPWEDIQRPANDYNVRLVPDTGPVRVYWGRDVGDRRLLIVELIGDNSPAFRRGRTLAQGVSVELRQAGTLGHQSLVFVLEKANDQDLFLVFCTALIEALRRTTDRADALHVSLAHLRRWKAFLASGRTHGLTPDELRGLFGELEILRELATRHLPTTAVEAWCGPFGGQQDFVYGDNALEVKTVFGSNRNSVRISSEDQLDAACANMTLCVLGIADIRDHRDSMSLNTKVKQVATTLSDPDAEEAFWTRLGAAGYVESSEYDAPELLITSRRVFRVDSTFPRITRAMLPEGVVRVSYDLLLEKIEQFEVRQETPWPHA